MKLTSKLQKIASQISRLISQHMLGYGKFFIKKPLGFSKPSNFHQITKKKLLFKLVEIISQRLLVDANFLLKRNIFPYFVLNELSELEIDIRSLE